MKNGMILGLSAIIAFAVMKSSVYAESPAGEMGPWSTWASNLQDANSLTVVNSQDDEGSPSDRLRNGEGGEDSGTEENGESASQDAGDNSSDTDSAEARSCGDGCSKCDPCRQRTKRCRKRSGILSRFRCR